MTNNDELGRTMTNQEIPNDKPVVIPAMAALNTFRNEGIVETCLCGKG